MTSMEQSPSPKSPAYTAEAASYFTDNDLRVPTVEEAAHTENTMRSEGMFAPGTEMFEGMLMANLVTVVDPSYGVSNEPGIR